MKEGGHFRCSILLGKHSSRLNHDHKMPSLRCLVLILPIVDYHETWTYYLSWGLLHILVRSSEVVFKINLPCPLS